MKNLKTNLIQLASSLLFLMLSSNYVAQMNEVTGGNIGVSLNGGMIMNKPIGAGYSFGAGITSGLKNIIFPEVNYSFQKSSFGMDTLGNETSVSTNNLGLALNNKIPIFHVKLGKSSKGECWWLNFKLLLDYQYNFQLSRKANFAFTSHNDNLLRFGLGIKPSYSGGHKSRVAWSYFYDVYYQLDLNKSDQLALQNTSWKQNGIYFRLTILHHKTADFLGGTSKKKAYGKKY